MKLPPLALAVLILGGFAIGLGVADLTDGEPIVVVQADTVEAARLRMRLHAAETLAQLASGERDGLRGALDDARRTIRGLEARRPERVVVYDTVVDLRRDTVILTVEIERGRADVVTAAPDSAGHRPEAREGIDVRDCDDGLLIRAGTVVCDRPRFGHLELFGALGARTTDFARNGTSAVFELGASWRPTFRSTFAVDLAARADGAFELRVRKGVRIF